MLPRRNHRGKVTQNSHGAVLLCAATPDEVVESRRMVSRSCLVFDVLMQINQKHGGRECQEFVVPLKSENENPGTLGA